MPQANLPDLHNVRRLLIIRLSSIGDVVHALPLSAALAEAYPHLELSWVVEEMSAEVVTGNPYLKEVIVVPRGRWRQGRLRSPHVWSEYLAFLAGLRQRRFEVTLDLQGYGKSALMALAAGAPYRLGWWRLRDGAGLVSRALPRRPESAHRVDWFLDVARALGVEPKTVRFPLSIPDVARAQVAARLCAAGIAPQRPYAVLNPATGNEVRRWGAERYAELAAGLASRFGLPSVLIGSGKDRPICEEVITRARQKMERASPLASATNAEAPLEPVSLAGQTNLKELAALLEGCAVQVCGDTGSAHIAAALGRPTIGLYGPTDPAHAGPWGQSENVLSHRALCHADCTVRQCAFVDAPPHSKREGEDAGPEGKALPEDTTARCLRAITPDEVLQRIERVLHDR
ncbi:MAG TPA: glycosyltransferase family 9 protein [Chthonomonadaceae bacterium]|nr:glycosyltransferase family 9 protein [Chthonomonadaceae bacterium]